MDCLWIHFQSLSPQKAFPLVYWLSLPTFSTSIALVDEKEKRHRGYCCDGGLCLSIPLSVCVMCLHVHQPYLPPKAISSNTSHNLFQLFSTIIISSAFVLAVTITHSTIIGKVLDNSNRSHLACAPLLPNWIKTTMGQWWDSTVESSRVSSQVNRVILTSFYAL